MQYKNFELTISHAVEGSPAHYEATETIQARTKKELFLSCLRTFGHCMGKIDDAWIFSRLEDEEVITTTVSVKVCDYAIFNYTVDAL
jgi:hypothetical protein